MNLIVEEDVEQVPVPDEVEEDVEQVPEEDVEEVVDEVVGKYISNNNTCEIIDYQYQQRNIYFV